jgi:hypothetical protein
MDSSDQCLPQDQELKSNLSLLLDTLAIVWDIVRKGFSAKISETAPFRAEIYKRHSKVQRQTPMPQILHIIL